MRERTSSEEGVTTHEVDWNGEVVQSALFMLDTNPRTGLQILEQDRTRSKCHRTFKTLGKLINRQKIEREFGNIQDRR